MTLLSLALGIYIGSLEFLTAVVYLISATVGISLLLISRVLAHTKSLNLSWLSGVAWCIVVLSSGACLAEIPKEQIRLLATPSREGIYQVTISRPPVARERGYRVEAIIQQVDTTISDWVGKRVMLYIYGDAHTIAPRTTYRVQGRLTPIYGLRQESYRHFLLSRHISGSLNVHSAVRLGNTLSPPCWSLWDQIGYYAYCLQQKVAGTFDQIKSLTPQQRDLLRAISIGDRSESIMVETQFRSIGVAHLLTVSGFHVGVILLLVYWIIYYPLRLIRSPETAYRLHWVVTLLVVWLYALVCGLSIPTMRAALMFSLFAVAHLCGRTTDRLNIWAQAALILLVISPYTLFDVGMQLSFIAVLAIFTTWGGLNKRINPSRSPFIRYIYYLLVTTASVQLFVLPILARSFGTSAIWSLLANLLMSPLITLLIVVALVTSGCLLLGLPTILLPKLLVGVSDLTSSTLTLLEQHFDTQLSLPMPLWLCILYYLLLYAWVQYFLTMPQRIRI